MGVDEELKIIKESLINLSFEGGTDSAVRLMEKGVHPNLVVESLRAGMDVVGEKFEKGDYFLAELVVAGAIAMDVVKVIEPHLKAEHKELKGPIILSTVEGDIHNIGKNIVGIMLTASGFQVIDLGESVSTSKLLEAVRRYKPKILGLSALLTATMVNMGKVIEAIKNAGFRDELKVIIGGAPVTDDFAREIGADYRAIDAVDGVNKCKTWVGIGGD